MGNLFQPKIDPYEIIGALPGNIYWKLRKKDGTFKYKGANRNVITLAGLNGPVELVGKTDFDLFEEDIANRLHSIDLEVFETGREIELEEEGINCQGARAIFLTTKKPLYKNGEIVGVMGISVDITERKRQELALADAHNTQSIIISNFSHETKTPLAVIQQSLQILKGKLANPEYKNYIDYIEKNTQLLLNLVTKIIKLTQTPTKLSVERSDEGATDEQSFNSRR
jgi:two-component system, OmpR family, aerobic respiration control sensor histidine kinase ArcB